MIGYLSMIEGAALVSACGAGGFLGFAWMRNSAKRAQQKRVAAQAIELSNARQQRKTPQDIVRLLVQQTKLCKHQSDKNSAFSCVYELTARWWKKQSVPLEYKRAISTEGIVRTSVLLGVTAAAIGGICGVLFTAELACVGVVVGMVIGVSAPFRALRRSAQAHRMALEAQLPEMLEVVALGMRSGLSFDRSFELFADHFDGVLAQDCAHAQRMWTMGLLTREEALRDLAASYGSVSFERIIESVIRSLRFGSSLHEVLEGAAAEARALYRSRIEEQVAKAPVKMMIPTGVLILPAMLLLVLGPVLLELMQGF